MKGKSQAIFSLPLSAYTRHKSHFFEERRAARHLINFYFIWSPFEWKNMSGLCATSNTQERTYLDAQVILTPSLGH